MNTALRTFLAFAVLSLGACSTTVKTFRIEAINTDGDEVICLVVVEHKWPQPGGTDKVYFTPADVPIEFNRDVVHVQVKPARVFDGTPAIPKAQDVTDYKKRGRDIRVDYPYRLTFILER